MSLQDVLLGLQKTYLASIPDKVAKIETLFKSNEIPLLKTEYHKLKGTGKTYGLPEITDIGAALEKICECDTTLLAQAVPLSIALLKRTQDLRVKGQSLDTAVDADFKTVQALVERLPK